MLLPLVDQPSDWRATPVSQLPRWDEAKRVALDLETCDPELTKLGPGVRRGARVVGIAFAIEDGPAHYLPIAHEGGGNLDPSAVWAYLRDQATAFGGDIVGANLQYDLDYLCENAVTFPATRFFRDVQVAEPLLDELQLTYSLDAIATRRGIPGKLNTQLERVARGAWGLDPKAELWRLPARHVAAYAVQDVALPLQLIRRQEREIDAQGLWGIYDIESRLLPVLVNMRRRGVRVDLFKLEQLELWAKGVRSEAAMKAGAIAGVPFGDDVLWRAEDVARVLRAIGVEPPRTPTGKPSTKAEFVEAIDHPAARAISRARKFDKLLTFCAQIRRHLIGDRVHCTFNQLRAQREDGGLKGVAFGRLSSTDFNLQQMPARDPEIAPRLRGIYVPDEGAQWAVIDFGSQEPRLTVHYASGAGCGGADEMVDRYVEDPKTDLHAAMAQMIGRPCPKCGQPVGRQGAGCPGCNGCGYDRKSAKAIFLGLCYGMGGAKLCRQLGLPTQRKVDRRSGRVVERAGAEGEELLRRFDEAVPFVRQLSKKVQRRAESRGYITTLLGRRCRFAVDEARSTARRTRYDWCYKALNRLIQGSAADQTKKAMLDAEAAGYRLQIQVHDEFDLSVSGPAEAQRLGEVMCNAVKLRVPTVVDVEVGESWGSVKPI